MWVSSGRRPMKSPPGGEMQHAAEAREQRAGEQERAADPVGELLVDLGLRDARRVDADLVLAQPFGLGAEVREQREHRVDVADPRDVPEHDGLVGEQAGGEDRQRAVLVPGGADVPADSGRPPSITNDSTAASLATVVDKAAAIVPAALAPTREQAWETLTSTRRARRCCATRSRSRRRRRSMPASFGEDEELWRVTALLHDFDYEIHPTLDKHPQDGAPILREAGYPEVVIDARALARRAPRRFPATRR